MRVDAFAASVANGWAANHDRNDDRWRIEPDVGCYVVGDGSGPRYGGYHAPFAIDAAIEALVPPRGTLREAFVRADRTARAMEAADRKKILAHFGASIVAVVIAGDIAQLGFVGSCRAYLARDGELTVVARDMCLPPPHQVVVTSLLGVGETAIETAERTLAPGDRLILCTPGLWRRGDEVVAQAVTCDGAAALEALLREPFDHARECATAVVITCNA